MKLIKEFKPITLVLETQKEVDYIYHKLNNNPKNTFDEYCKTKKVKFNMDFSFEMFIKFQDSLISVN